MQIVSVFLASSAVALCLSTVYLCLKPAIDAQDSIIDFWIPELLPLVKDSIKNSASARRRIDRLKAGVPLSSRKATRGQEIWARVIEKIILNLSDQLLLTGLAVLVAGFWTRCSISVYHFAIVSDLAWFASNVHLITLAVLWEYLRDKPVLRNWRALLMACTASLLIASTILQGHRAWYDSWPYDAQCVFNDYTVGSIGGSPARWMYTNLFLIAIDYPPSILRLYQVNFCRKWLYSKPREGMRRAVETFERMRPFADTSSALTIRVKRGLYSGCVMILRSFCFVHSLTYLSINYVFNSRWFNLLFCISWYVVGLISLLKDKNIPREEMDDDENKMSFGQIVPILVFGSTIIVAREAFESAY